MNKNTKGVKWVSIPVPEAVRHKRHHIENEQTMVFRTLDSTITGYTLKEWCSAINHHILFADETYAIPKEI